MFIILLDNQDKYKSYDCSVSYLEINIKKEFPNVKKEFINVKKEFPEERLLFC